MKADVKRELRQVISYAIGVLERRIDPMVKPRDAAEKVMRWEQLHDQLSSELDEKLGIEPGPQSGQIAALARTMRADRKRARDVEYELVEQIEGLEERVGLLECQNLSVEFRP